MKLKSNLTYISYFEGIQILPNISEISEDKFSLIEDHPIFISKLENGDFEILEGSATEPKTMSPQKAIKFINEIIDINLLKTELEKETRSTVKKAIEARIADITSKEEKKPA
ncbi:MAG: hypothetical protein K2X69_14165 [Silvanigrellaceae bacterium]|nr:hypothetical protein [Silvanigrellaceae bacterium]